MPTPLALMERADEPGEVGGYQREVERRVRFYCWFLWQMATVFSISLPKRSQKKKKKPLERVILMLLGFLDD